MDTGESTAVLSSVVARYHSSRPLIKRTVLSTDPQVDSTLHSVTVI